LRYVSAVDREGANDQDCWRTSRRRKKRFIVRDEKLTAFLELEAGIPSRSFSF
jgi:hypothetical protein